MRRFTELFVWAAVIALFALFLGGVFYSFLVRDDEPHIDSTDWHGK
jgi:hypothetical protein